MSKNIFISGHSGMVGSAIFRSITQRYPKNNIIIKSRSELNLLDQHKTQKFFCENKIDEVYLCAAKVGGILANSSYPYDFLYENMQMELNIINSAIRSNVPKLLFLGSSCIYPKFSKQPIKEEYLLSGNLEETNEPYALAKISGIKLCESANIQFGLDYRSLMPTNLYGPGDLFDLENSHVLPALISKFVDAVESNKKEVVVWGSGMARREFLHVDDLATAAVYFLNMDSNKFWKKNNKNISHINIVTGIDISIYELACLIKKITNYEGEIFLDKTKPDGMPQKLLDIDKALSFGWHPQTAFTEGLTNTVNWYKKNKANNLVRGLKR